MRGFRTFINGISQKANIITWVEFELTHCNITVQHISHYVTGTTTNTYIQKSEFDPENETHKIVFDIKMDHPIEIKRPNLVLINKKERVILWILLF